MNVDTLNPDICHRIVGKLTQCPYRNAMTIVTFVVDETDMISRVDGYTVVLLFDQSKAASSTQTYIVDDRILDCHILAMAYVEGISIVSKCGLSILHELVTIPAINGDAIYNEIRCCN